MVKVIQNHTVSLFTILNTNRIKKKHTQLQRLLNFLYYPNF